MVPFHFDVKINLAKILVRLAMLLNFDNIAILDVFTLLATYMLPKFTLLPNFGNVAKILAFYTILITKMVRLEMALKPLFFFKNPLRNLGPIR